MKEDAGKRIKEDIGKRIREAREKKGLKSGDLATLCGWEESKSRISNYENGTSSPSYSDMVTIGRALKTNPAWLAFGGKLDDESNSPAIKPKAEGELISAEIEPWDNSTPLANDEVAINFFTEVEAAAGNGNLVYIENHGPKLRFSKSTLRKAGVDPAAAVCIMVTGDSMEPVIPDGTVVGVNTASTQIKDGALYVVKQSDILRIKILSRVPSGYRLKSYNQEYETETITGEEAQGLEVVGKVFWYSVLLKP